MWDPAIFSYATVIEEEHDKKREAVLKHKTTGFMDFYIEFANLDMYWYWLIENRDRACEGDNLRMKAWFDELALELSGFKRGAWRVLLV